MHCTPLVSIDSVYIKDKKYYPRGLLMGERYKNIDIKIYSYDADGGHFDKIYSHERYFED